MMFVVQGGELPPLVRVSETGIRPVDSRVPVRTIKVPRDFTTIDPLQKYEVDIRLDKGDAAGFGGRVVRRLRIRGPAAPDANPLRTWVQLFQRIMPREAWLSAWGWQMSHQGITRSVEGPDGTRGVVRIFSDVIGPEVDEDPEKCPIRVVGQFTHDPVPHEMTADILEWLGLHPPLMSNNISLAAIDTGYLKDDFSGHCWSVAHVWRMETPDLEIQARRFNMSADQLRTRLVRRHQAQERGR